MATKKTVSKQQQKKKRWFNILASPEFRNVIIGETPSFAPESLVGRSIRVNLMTMTRDPKKQNFSVSFKVKEIKGSDAHTELARYEMGTVHIKRVVKRGKDKVDDSFVVTTSDNVQLRVKPFLITKNKVQHSVLTTLRKVSREFIESEAKGKSCSDFWVSVLSSDLQRSMRGVLKKIYPLALVEIRMLVRL
ncbi:MAG: hypothetical protein AABY09_01640 [Nanoarchaeota archaeon]